MQVVGQKRPTAAERPQRPLQQQQPGQPGQPPAVQAHRLLQHFRQAVATGSNPFFPALPAAGGSERCAAGSARSECATQAALAYFDQLLASLGCTPHAGPSSAAAAGEQVAPAAAPASPAAADSGAITAADAEQFVKLADSLPQLRGSLQACKRQGTGCCGVGRARRFIRCLQSWNALSLECTACWDSLYVAADY